MEKLPLVIGLMSGTSLDGVDAALIETDGVQVGRQLAAVTIPYDSELREGLRSLFGLRRIDDVGQQWADAMTRAHVKAVWQLLQKAGMRAQDVACIGFHGQTIFHAPADRVTVQIGNGAMLAEMTGIAVVDDFRSADVAAGGQGAPLVPLYHQALAGNLVKPVAVLNIGGVANVTFIGADGAVMACDTGPGNALIDDWLLRHTGVGCDVDGKMAALGTPDSARVAAWLEHSYFSAALPKSLDRNQFAGCSVEDLSLEDGAATLVAFTVASIARVVALLPEKPARWLVCGGGRHNPVLMQMLRERLGVAVEAVEAVAWDGDALEAQAFAFLAMRSRLGLPLSMPTTTGVPEPMTGGKFHPARHVTGQGVGHG